jgi:hypothetical protein
VLACKAMIALMMEAASTSETSVNFHQTTRRNNPEDSHIHTRSRENQKSHFIRLRFRYLLELFVLKLLQFIMLNGNISCAVFEVMKV